MLATRKDPGVVELGPLAAAPAKERFGACRESNEALRAGASPARSSSWETGSRRRRRRPWFRRWGRRSRDEAEDFFESDDPGTGDASWCEPDSLECDSRDCGFDCSP